MSVLKLLVSSILAGVCISVGGTVYLILGNSVSGALLFTIGLFTICIFGFHLFTGRVCVVAGKRPMYALVLVIIWIGNLIGAFLTVLLESCTRYAGILQERASTLAFIKLSDNWLSVLILAFFCNLLIYLAVIGYSECKYEIGKFLSLFLGVSVFVLCGFEHSVADMYYLLMAKADFFEGALFLMIVTLGNLIGGALASYLRAYFQRSEGNI